MAEENKAEKLSVVKLVPLSAALAGISQISTLYSYRYFNFNPVPYFEPVEILSSSLHDFIIICLILYMYVQFLLINVEDFKRFIIMKMTRKLKNMGEPVLVAKKSSLKSLYYIIPVIIILSLINWLRMDNFSQILAGILFFLACGVFAFINTVRFERIIIPNNARSRRLIKIFPYINKYILVASVIIISAMLLLGLARSRSVKNDNPYKGTLLITEDDDTITCTHKAIFIGKSQKYYFVYNTPDSSVRVIARENLKREVVKFRPDVNFLFRF